MALAEKPRTIPKEEILPQYKEFEGVRIQWNKVPWNFEHPELGTISIDTYSVWNPNHHEEIANRLARGQRAAFNMMGTFGVAEVRGKRKYREHDPIFEDIKQRDKMQTLVVFTHPDNIQGLIDFDRLPKEFAHFSIPGKRRELYKGPMHAIFPIIPDNLPDLGLIREDKDAAFFWIPGHFGYEELGKKVKGKINGNVLAGGSLNIHGQSPAYSMDELRIEMQKHKEWLTGVDFVINDEFANGIARSHTQVSFMEHPARIVRKGSLSLEKITRDTGLLLIYAEDVKEASSKIPYDEENNQQIDNKIDEALARMARYGNKMVDGQ